MTDRPKIVVGLLDESQEFQRMQAEDARAAAGDAGLDVEVLYAENNAILQIQQLFKVVQAPDGRRPRVVLAETVAGEGMERLGRAAVRAGIGWILINRRAPYLDELRREHPGLPVGMISTDQVEIGRIQGRQFHALLPDGGLVVYVQGSADTSAAQERLVGARESSARSGIDLKVVEGRWTEVSGEEAVSRWLRLKQVEASPPRLVGCQNDAMAVGARQAMAAAAAKNPLLARIPVTGVDGLREGGQRHVQQGTLAATVIVPSNTGPAIRLVAEVLKGRASFPREHLLRPSSFPDLVVLGSNSSRPAR